MTPEIEIYVDHNVLPPPFRLDCTSELDNIQIVEAVTRTRRQIEKWVDVVRDNPLTGERRQQRIKSFLCLIVSQCIQSFTLGRIEANAQNGIQIGCLS